MYDGQWMPLHSKNTIDLWSGKISLELESNPVPSAPKATSLLTELKGNFTSATSIEYLIIL